jgi:hypothetical protein
MSSIYLEEILKKSTNKISVGRQHHKDVFPLNTTKNEAEIFTSLWEKHVKSGLLGQVLNTFAVIEMVLNDLLTTYFNQLKCDWDNYPDFHDKKSKIFEQCVNCNLPFEIKIRTFEKIFNSLDIEKRFNISIPKQELNGLYELRNIVAHSELFFHENDQKNYLIYRKKFSDNVFTIDLSDFCLEYTKCAKIVYPLLVKIDSIFAEDVIKKHL